MKLTPRWSPAVSAAIVLLLVTNCTLAAVALLQRVAIIHLQSAVAIIEVEPVTSNHVALEFEVIDSATDLVSKVTFNQKCKGEVKYVVPAGGGGLSDEALAPYCVGTNNLSAINSKGNEIVIDSRPSTSVNDAPVLLDVERVRGSKILLVTYAVVPCTLSEDACGVGAGLVGANIAYDTVLNTSRALIHYPSIGTPIWNSAGTKALFPVVQVGGAGCDDRPIVGYDLRDDSSAQVTVETACEFSDGVGSDVEGNPVPEWGPVFWTSDDAFTAVLLNVDGSVEQLDETF